MSIASIHFTRSVVPAATSGKRRSMFALAAAALLAATSAHAQCFQAGQPTGTSGPDSASGDRFGNAIAISGDTAVFGARGDDHAGGVDAGAAFVYIRSGATWIFQQKLVAADAAASDSFGDAVAINGNVIIVGAPLEDNAGGSNAGAAYIFTRSGTTWTQTIKLTATDGAANDNFGDSVALSTFPLRMAALVGSPRDGSVYPYSINTIFIDSVWTAGTKFQPNDAPVSFFGVAVAASGSTVIVGSLDRSAYAFTSLMGTTWVQQQKLEPQSGSTGNFGASVAITGSTTIIGSSGEDTDISANAGAAYVFVRTAGVWNLEQRLFAPDGMPLDGFGSSVALTTDRAIVGTPRLTAFGDDRGAAYLFTRLNGVWTSRSRSFGVPAAGEQYGTSVAIQNWTMMAGSPLFDCGGANVDCGRVQWREISQLDITQPPVSTSTCAHGSAVFSVSVLANPAAEFQWQYRSGGSGLYTILADGVNNSSGGQFLLNASGATTGTLTVNRNPVGWFSAAPHQFRLSLSSAGCFPQSPATIWTLTICRADFNCSGEVTVQDIFDFLEDYFGGNLGADVNNSGGLSVQDVFDFLSAYFTGCA